MACRKGLSHEAMVRQLDLADRPTIVESRLLTGFC